MNQNAAIIDQRLNAQIESIRDRAAEELKIADEEWLRSDVSLQQLSATFRRGDLIEKLDNLDRRK